MKNFNKLFILAMINILFLQNLFLLPAALADDGTIKIAGQPVFSISSAADSASLAKRAETVQNNLDNALVAAQDRSPAAVNIAYVKGIPVITLGGYQVVTISTQDATAAHTTPALLANQWADAVRGALVNQASINSYVAQLSGNYALSAPPATAAPVNKNQAALGKETPALGNIASNSSSSATYTSPTNSPGPGNFAPNSPSPIGGGPFESYNSSSNYNNPGNAGYNNPGNYGVSAGGAGYRQGRIVYAPVGQIIPITLKTSIATQVAKPGDLIEGSVSQNINLGDSSIPAGATVVGQVSSAKAGGRFTKSGELQIKFTQLQLPDGSQVPISAHIVGGIGKYASGKQPDQVEGETWKNKVGSVAFRGLIGAGAGAALGTGVGAIAGGGYGAGTGAWSGAAIGSGVGVADSLILRKGKDVTVPSGTNIQLQLDQPISIGAAPSGYSGNAGGSYVGNYTGGSNNGYGGGYNAGPNGGGYNASPNNSGYNSSGYNSNAYNGSGYNQQ